MHGRRSEDGTWVVELDEGDAADPDGTNVDFVEALPRYMTALDPAFIQARERSEFQFLLCLLRIRGVKDAGWEPYETTCRAVTSVCAVHRQVEDYEAKQHLALWLYGHILEASEPYELLANLIAVAGGDGFRLERFPVPKK